MKKLFISVPMNGRKEEDIFKSMEKMHKIAEIMTGEDLDAINSWITDEPPKNCKNEGVWYLAKSINLMSQADYFIGVREGWRWKGCCIEHETANLYGITTMTVDAKEIAPDITIARDVSDGNNTGD